MLKGIDAVDWSKLSHAYGKAKDIPELLRGLTSPAPKKRAHAIYMLGASICHQGTFYSATPKTIPFLIALLEEPKLADKDAILGLLADVATLDDHDAFLFSGVTTLPKLPDAYLRSITLVRKAWATYATLLGAREATVRAEAAFLLAWLPDSAKDTISQVRAALAKEKDKQAKVALALALAYLGRYLESKVDAPLFEKLLGEKDLAVRSAAAIALAHLGAGKVTDDVASVLAEAASTKRLVVKASSWLGGNLGLLAVRVLSALPRSPQNDERLVTVVEKAGSDFAANVLARRLFKVVKGAGATKKAKRIEGERHDLAEDATLAAITLEPDALDPLQRRLLEAVHAQPKAFDGPLGKALGERGLPDTASLLDRWLHGSKPREESILDRKVGKKTLAQLFVDAVKARDAAREKIIQTMRSDLTPEEQVDLALVGLVEIDISWAASISLELMWVAAPKAQARVAEAQASLAKKGVPKRVSRYGSHLLFPMAKVAVGVGLCAIALAKKKPADPVVDALLQEAYGFWPRVRDALVALPIARRERWVLSSKRDDQGQPSDGFKGAWPYWMVVPTKKIADRALAHVKKWKKEDPWGGARKKFADPHLVAFIAALRAAGNKADAARCQAALDALP